MTRPLSKYLSVGIGLQDSILVFEEEEGFYITRFFSNARSFTSRTQNPNGEGCRI
jgi:hypothetical protein